MKATFFNLIILDESGSMSHLVSSTISGCNETINSIKSIQEKNTDSQEHYVSIYCFQSFSEVPSRYLCENIPANEAKHISDKDYRPWGFTPLYDAIGFTLKDLEKQTSKTEGALASVTIITDGYENSSRHFTGAQIVKLIDRLKELGWNFNFIGANIDAASVARQFHIDNSMQFEANKEDSDRMWSRQRSSRDLYFSKARMRMKTSSSMNEFRHKMSLSSRNFFYDEEELRGRITPDTITSLQPDEVFVFGSDMNGIHDGGAAAYAVRHFGAIRGQGEGPQGQSYAIPTTSCSFMETHLAIENFIEHARMLPDTRFYVTRIGCGNAGYTDEQIAPLFVEAMSIPNIYLPKSFIDILLRGA